jgi:hypothetical protein
MALPDLDGSDQLGAVHGIGTLDPEGLGLGDDLVQRNHARSITVTSCALPQQNE